MMARKNPFEKVLGATPGSDTPAKSQFAARGASRSISNTLDDLADKADRLLEGETVVELDPTLIDPSFLKDRQSHDDLEFAVLKSAIADDGQNSPILVRPHPSMDGRYMVVFGARRRRAAEELGIKVRAVVKEMDDKEHVIAQGQENAARADLSFIEKAMMASNVVQRKYDSDNATAMSALSIDKATLSKMLSVAAIDMKILDCLKRAKAIGRDRWYELKTLLDRPANLKRARSIIDSKEFEALHDNDRFNLLHSTLKNGRKITRGASTKPTVWSPKDSGVEVSSTTRGKSFTLAVKAKDLRGIEFGEFVSERLETLYEQFKAETQK